MRDLDSYLAGIFDGEGCISVGHKPHSFRRGVHTALMVRVGMQTIEPLDLLQQRFGGRIHAPHDPDNKMRVWYLTGVKARPALEVFARLCIVKQTQASFALRVIELLEEPRSRTGRRGGRSITDENETERASLALEIKRAKYVST